MKTINKLRNRKAVSPVIATVILVAVAITVSVAVSYWMSGIAGQYTGFEKVEIQGGVCNYKTYGTTDCWEIIVQLKNSGTKAATLTDVFVNDVETNYILTSQIPGTTGNSALLDPDPAATIPGEPLYLESGVTGIVTVWVVDDIYQKLSAGTTVNIKIHSASGMDYIKLVQLT